MIQAWLPIDGGEILSQNLSDLINLTIEVADKDGTAQHDAGDGFGDLRLTAAGDSARFVTECWVGPRSDQPPGTAAVLLFETDFSTPWQNIGVGRAESEPL